MFLIRCQTVFFSALVGTLVLGLSGCAPSPQDSAPYQVSNASIRIPLPSRTVTAGYFDFKNNSDEIVTIVGISSDVAARIEMHTIKKVGQQMRMRPLPTVTVEPRAQVAFTSGGKHLMLFDAELAESPSILKIELANGVVVEAPFQHTELIDAD